MTTKARREREDWVAVNTHFYNVTRASIPAVGGNRHTRGEPEKQARGSVSLHVGYYPM
jgi:hypothetical protein